MSVLPNKLSGFFYTVALGLALPGCSNIEKNVNLLPKFTKSTSVDDTNCAITKERSANFGLILELLVPFLLPFSEGKDTTKTDENCWDRLVTEKLLQHNDNDSRAMAVAIYDQLDPLQKEKIDLKLKTQGVSMEDIARDWPRVVSVQEQKNCTVVRYQMPEQAQHQSVVAFRCRPAVNQNKSHEPT